MSVVDPVLSFISLSDIDQQLLRLQLNLQHVSEQKNNVVAVQHRESGRLIEAKNHTQKLLREIHQLELEDEALAQSIRAKQAVLAACSNIKEYSSLEKELMGLEERYVQLEQQTLKALYDHESAEKECVRLGQEITVELNTIGMQLTQLTEQETNLTQQITGLTAERQSLLKSLPEEWLKDYQTVRERYPNPVVKIERSSCSGCFNALTESFLTTIKRKRLMRCPDCHRFLY